MPKHEEWPSMDYEEAGKEAYASGEPIRFSATPTGERFTAMPTGEYVREEMAEQKQSAEERHEVLNHVDARGSQAKCVCGWRGPRYNDSSSVTLDAVEQDGHIHRVKMSRLHPPADPAWYKEQKAIPKPSARCAHGDHAGCIMRDCACVCHADLASRLQPPAGTEPQKCCECGNLPPICRGGDLPECDLADQQSAAPREQSESTKGILSPVQQMTYEAIASVPPEERSHLEGLAKYAIDGWAESEHRDNAWQRAYDDECKVSEAAVRELMAHENFYTMRGANQPVLDGFEPVEQELAAELQLRRTRAQQQQSPIVADGVRLGVLKPREEQP
jgi:hypothetical protein